MRRDFVNRANHQEAAVAKARAIGGSAERDKVHALCADELRERVKTMRSLFLDTHRAMSAPPSNEQRRVGKDWIAERIAEEVDDLQQLGFFHRPRAYPTIWRLRRSRHARAHSPTSTTTSTHCCVTGLNGCGGSSYEASR